MTKPTVTQIYTYYGIFRHDSASFTPNDAFRNKMYSTTQEAQMALQQINLNLPKFMRGTMAIKPVPLAAIQNNQVPFSGAGAVYMS